MKRYFRKKQLCFDDILLVPQHGHVESRSDVDTTMILGMDDNSRAQITLRTPIIASPMDTVCDTQMVLAMANAGGIGILHRFMDRHLIISRAEYLTSKGVDFGVSVSTKDTADDRYIKQLIVAGVSLICIDTANGHSSLTVEAVLRLRKIVPNHCHIMVGNVSTREGLLRLIGAGADSVRVGIGGGSACSTRIVSGHGLPTLASLMDCFRGSDGLEGAIIADGGIRNTGDMVKAFAAGATAIMLGGLLAGHDESPRKYDDNDEIIYRGMASADAQMDWSGSYKSVEGVSGTVPFRGSVVDTINSFRFGIASGCSYTGVDRLSELSDEAQYVVVSDLTAQESSPRI